MNAKRGYGHGRMQSRDPNPNSGPTMISQAGVAPFSPEALFFPVPDDVLVLPSYLEGPELGESLSIGRVLGEGNINISLLLLRNYV